MAQAQYDEFIKLRKSGIDAKTARIQAYGDAVATPVQPEVTTAVQAPAVTPEPAPTPVTPTAVKPSFTPMFGDASVPTPTATPVPEPVVPQTTPVVTPVQPTPAEKITQTDFQKAQAESEKIKAQNQAQIEMRKQESAISAEERKAIAEEQRIASIPTDSGAIFSTLKAGGSVPKADTPEYRQATARYNTFRKFSTYDVASLSTALQGGDLLMGTQAYTDLTSDPTMLAKIQRARAFTSGVVNLEEIGTKQAQYVMSNNPTVAQALEDGYMSQDEYNSLTSNAEVVTQAKIVSEKKAEYDKYASQLENISDEVDEEYADKAVSESFKSAVKSNRDKAIRRLFNTASDEYQNATGLYTELKNSSTALLEINMKQYETQQAQEAQLAQEARQQQYSMDMADYNANLSLQTSQAEFEQNLEQQAQMASDPTTAISGILSQFAELGIVGDVSLAGHLAGFQASGLSLEDYTNQMIKDFKAKPQYSQIMAKNAGEGISYQTIGDKVYRMNADGSFTLTNIDPTSATSTSPKWEQDASGNWYDANSATSPVDQIATNSTYLKVPRTGNNVGQDTNNPGNIMGDTEGQRNIALGYGAIGFYKSPNGRTYAVFPDMQTGTNASMADLQAKLSGGSSWATPNTSLEKFASGWVSGPNAPINQNAVANYVKLTGYPKNTPISQIPIDVLAKAVFANEGVDISKSANLSGIQGTGTQASQYTDQNIADLSYLTELQEKNPTQAAKDMKELGYTARDLANYKSGNVPLTDKQKNSSIDIMESIKELTDSSRYEWNDAVGKFDITRVIGTQDAEDAAVAINNLVAKLTLPNLGVLKGPMSDKDIQFIKEASSKLSTIQSNDSFERNLVDAYNLAARRAGQPEIKTLSDLSKDSQSTVGGEADYNEFF